MHMYNSPFLATALELTEEFWIMCAEDRTEDHSIATTTTIGSSYSQARKKKNIKDVRVALWGFGNQNKLLAKYLHERQVPIVAVISHHDIGKDYTSVDLGSSGKKIGGTESGVKIVGEDSAKETLFLTKPDICIISTRSNLEDILPSLKVCAKSNVNVITIAEEVLNSWSTNPKLTRKVDSLFQYYGVTLTGSGFEDVAVGEMMLTLSSLMHRITSIKGSEQYNLNEQGAAVAEQHGVGLTPSQFQKEIVETPQASSLFQAFNGWFVSAFGLTLMEMKEKREPTFAKRPIWSPPLQREIPVGECTGMKVIVSTATKEGISIVSQFICKSYGPDDRDESSWGFQGEPDGVEFSMPLKSTSALTNTATISRILQVLDAPPGYVTSDQLPPPLTRYEPW